MPHRVLYVEDHDDTRVMLSSLLRLRGYHASAAPTLEAARRLAAAEPFDLFILDIKLADGSGLDLCRELRSAYPAAPVIVYSASARDADHELARAAGAAECVDKPHVAELVEAIVRHLGRSGN